MNKMYQFKISLKYSEPSIWRRVLVPVSFTFKNLHSVIQALFGWENSHLHEFSAGEAFQSEKIGGSQPLDNYFVRTRQKAIYVYDFGDGWEHEILFEKLAENTEGLNHPLCIEGGNNAPPEDCGGIGGYYSMLEAVGDKKHPDHYDLLEWLGDGFDPSRFDVDSINKRLKRLKCKKTTPPQTIAGTPVEGQILDNGMCICAVCGKRARFGATIKPHSNRKTFMILCKRCTIRESAKRNGTTIKAAKDKRERMFATQHLMHETFIERYLDESGKQELSDIDEANAVLHQSMKWWNEELSIQDRIDIENLSLEEQRKVFLEAPVEFYPSAKTIIRNNAKVGRNDLCPCGSGKKFKKCCLEKMH